MRYINALARDPSNVKLALVAAGLPSSPTDQRLAEVWPETLLIRREIRLALDKVGANADYLAERVKEEADWRDPATGQGNIQALKLLAMLRGHNEQPNKQTRRDAMGGDTAGDELRRRARIIEIIGLPDYPIPPGEAGAPHPGGDAGEKDTGISLQEAGGNGAAATGAGEAEEIVYAGGAAAREGYSGVS